MFIVQYYCLHSCDDELFILLFIMLMFTINFHVMMSCLCLLFCLLSGDDEDLDSSQSSSLTQLSLGQGKGSFTGSTKQQSKYTHGSIMGLGYYMDSRQKNEFLLKMGGYIMGLGYYVDSKITSSCCTWSYYSDLKISFTLMITFGPRGMSLHKQVRFHHRGIFDGGQHKFIKTSH